MNVAARRGTVLAIVSASCVIGTLAAVGYLLVGLGHITRQFASARIESAQAANGQRDLLLFHDAIVRMAIGGRRADAELHRGLALQQLTTLASQRDGRDVRALIATVRGVDLTAVQHDRVALEQTDRRLTAAERRFKAMYDERDLRFQQLVDDALRARMNAQRLVALLIVASLIACGTWVVLSLRRSRGALDRARRAAEASERRFRSLVQASSDLTVLVDGVGTIVYASPAAHDVVGRSPTSLEGQPMLAVVLDEDRPAFQACLHRLTDHGARERLELRILHTDGVVRQLEAVGANRLGDPSVGAFVFNMRDVTERRRLEAELADLAFRDPLTGLANRARLHQEVERELLRTRRPDDPGVALLLVDLDDFKAINDASGHDEGDQLLIAIADRLRGCVADGALVARLGGDEFVVFATGVDGVAATHALADAISSTFAEPVAFAGRVLDVSASVGVRYAHSEGVTPLELLRDADLAMYRAKSTGKGGWRLFDPSMLDDAAVILALRGDLRQALDDHQFSLHYQPVVDIADGRVRGFEALARWEHPTIGKVAPDRFIPLAEQTGLISELGRWAIGEAAHAARRLQEASGDPDLRVAVNVSPRQLDDDGIVDVTRTALRSSGIRPGTLTLEVTESMFVDDSEPVIRRLDALRALGVSVALDDFGTGFSSLHCLERLPLDILKIDRSFVSSMAAAPGREKVVRTIVELSRSLGLRTVAEGIETADQQRALAGFGCDFGQGYLFSRPLPEAQALACVTQGSLRRAA